MSAEFERIVLSKLNSIELKLEEHDKKFDRIDAKFDMQEERLKKQDERLDKQDERLKEQEARLKKQDERLDKQDERLDRQEKILMENSKKLDNLIETVNIQNNLFIKFEYDFNLKMQATLDTIAGLTEKYSIHDDILTHYNAKLLNHDIRILALEEEKEKYLK